MYSHNVMSDVIVVLFLLDWYHLLLSKRKTNTINKTKKNIVFIPFSSLDYREIVNRMKILKTEKEKRERKRMNLTNRMEM